MNDLAKMIQMADNGDLNAMIDVAYYILFDDMTVPVEEDLLERAIGYLKKAIEAGRTEAMISYGALFYNGRGVEQDFDEAIHWYKQAADRGNPDAVSYMGYMYYYGRGNLDVNMELAYQYFSKTAMLGVPNAYYKCGDMFFYGKYVAKDPFTAYRLYSQCYEMVQFDQPMDCYPDVCRRLGTCYHKGIGTEKDLKKAEEFLAEARRLFQKRIDDGDQFTDNVLQQATKEWLEVTRELES